MFLSRRSSNLNGVYALSPDPVAGNPDHILLIGTETEIGVDGENGVRGAMLVYPDSMQIDEINMN